MNFATSPRRKEVRDLALASRRVGQLASGPCDVRVVEHLGLHVHDQTQQGLDHLFDDVGVVHDVDVSGRSQLVGGLREEVA